MRLARPKAGVYSQSTPRVCGRPAAGSMTMPDESIGMAAGLVPSETLHRGETIVTGDGGSDGRGRSVFQSPPSRGNDCHKRAWAMAGKQRELLSVPCIAG